MLSNRNAYLVKWYCVPRSISSAHSFKALWEQQLWKGERVKIYDNIPLVGEAIGSWSIPVAWPVSPWQPSGTGLKPWITETEYHPLVVESKSDWAHAEQIKYWTHIPRVLALQEQATFSDCFADGALPTCTSCAILQSSILNWLALFLQEQAF